MKRTDIDKLPAGTAVLVGPRDSYSSPKLCYLTGRKEERNVGRYSFEQRIVPHWEVQISTYHVGTGGEATYHWAQSRDIHQTVEDPEAWIAEQEAGKERQRQTELNRRWLSSRRYELEQELNGDNHYDWAPGRLLVKEAPGVRSGSPDFVADDDVCFIVHVPMSLADARAWLAERSS